MTFRLFAALALATAAASAAFADPGPTPTGAPSTPTVAGATHKKAVDPNLDSSALVCKREDATGTRLGATKICHTRAEWAARSQASHDATEQMQSNSSKF